MKNCFNIFFTLLVLLLSQKSRAQEAVINTDSSDTRHGKYHLDWAHDRIDLIDVLHDIIKRGNVRIADSIGQVKSYKTQFSAIPAAGYTLQTGFAALAVANAVFYTNKDTVQNNSNIFVSLTYSQYHQIILPVLSNIWTKNNKYDILTDWRYVKYPSYTYGLGNYTTQNDQYTIDYSGLRLHETVLRAIGRHGLYAGLGYDFDYFWNIREVDPPPNKQTDFERYGLTKNSFSSGITLNVLYDTRNNSLNADKGTYVNATYRPNFTFLGSDDNWQSLQIDFRKYVRLPGNSDNVLAFWNFDWFTPGSGNPPYLMLPNTGGDPYSNTGRGYIQGRFRSKNMLYAETEYRFKLVKNGLFGGVVFVNAQSFTEEASNRFEVISPGYGAGLRIKLNKLSNTNVAIDYGFGANGSKGFFVNLGEVF